MSLLHGADSTGKAIPLLVDASGRAIVIGSGTGGAIEVVQDTPADLAPGIYGWDGSVWQKLSVDASGRPLVLSHGHDGTVWRPNPMLIGYQSLYRDFKVDLAITAGAYQLNGTVVPTGYLVIVTGAAFNYTGTPPTSGVLRILSGGLGYPILTQLAPTSGVFFSVSGQWLMGAGENMQVSIVGATLNDDVYLRVHGYQMRVDL